MMLEVRPNLCIEVPSQVPSQDRQVQVKLQVLEFKLQVLNKSLVLFAQITVSVLITI